MAQSAEPNNVGKWYAEKMGWKLSSGNVMVEGTADVAYFELASRLHFQKTGMRLLDHNLSIFASGLEEEGGAYGIQARFPTIFDLNRLDTDANGRLKYQLIAVFDDDDIGRSAMKSLLYVNRLLKEYVSVFLLRREMPLRPQVPAQLGMLTTQQNQQFAGANCTIEDMLSDSLAQRFLSGAQNVLARPINPTVQTLHLPWNVAGKAQLREFAEKTATWNDVERLVNALRALRSYVGLPPEGSSS
jgi:hypothetical protein